MANPPPPPGQPHVNGVGNGPSASIYGRSAPSGGADRARSALAGMNLRATPAAPGPRPTAPGAGGGRPVPSTPGRVVAVPRFPPRPPPPPSFGSMPPSTPAPAPRAPSAAGGIRGPPGPPPSPMHPRMPMRPPAPAAPSAPRSMPMARTAGPMAPPPPNHSRMPPPSPMPPPQHRQQFQRPQPQQHHSAMQVPPPPPVPSRVQHPPPPPPAPYGRTVQQPQPPPPPMPGPPPPPPTSYPQPPPPHPGPRPHPQPHEQWGQQQRQQQQPQQQQQQPRAPPQQRYPPPPAPPHQQQQQQHQQQQPQPHRPREKIDPSQIPRIPLFTRPHQAPATVYPSRDPHGAMNGAMNAAGSLGALGQAGGGGGASSTAALPPPSDARYVAPGDFQSAGPRIVRSTVHAFPADGATARKCDLPLGLVVNPLAGLSDLCGGGGGGSNATGGASGVANGPSSSSRWSGRDQGEVYGGGNDSGELDYVPPVSDPDETADPERVPVLRGPWRQDKKTAIHSSTQHGDAPSSKCWTRAVTPPRCDICNAYLNPFCAPSSQSQLWGGGTQGAYSPVQKYDCNMCGASSSFTLSEEAISNGTFDAATRCGTVEYEVGGPYEVRKDGPVQNVHLYGVEYVPPSAGAASAICHRHHSTSRSHGWHEALGALREVGRGLATTAPKREDKDGKLVSEVRIGLFAFYQDMLVFPYLKQPKPKIGVDAPLEGEEREEDAELEVAVVSDVTEDPFCPLPLHMLTYNVGDGLHSVGWKHFERIMDSISELMEQLIGKSPAQDLTRNCGGAALAALASALHDSGGRATLITTRRPNHGVGALRDREGNQMRAQSARYTLSGQAQQEMQQQARRERQRSNPYQRATDEQRLFMPLQRLVTPNKGLPTSIHPVDAECNDGRAGLFYRELGETCARQRVRIDIVVASSAVNLAESPAEANNFGPGSVHPNPREFLDVATLAEVCRATCGRFKWLRVGNECGVKVGQHDYDDSQSFTGEQLREELKQSALAYGGSDVVFKLRCSNGVQVKSYTPALPNGTLIGDGIVDSAELELSSFDSSTSIAVMLEHKVGGVQDTLKGRRKGVGAPMVYFQSATLYTTTTGRRRVRVSTLGLATTNVPAEVFRSADLGTVAAIMTRQAVSDLEDPAEGSLHNARFRLFERCTSILAQYRLYTTARSSPVGQLILPESLQLLPLFVLSLRKSRLLRGSAVPYRAPFPSADERAYHAFYGRTASPDTSVARVHPSLLRVSDLRARDGEWITPSVMDTQKFVADEQVAAASMRPVCQLPTSTNPSVTCLDEGGIYLLDDRFAFYLYIGKEVPEEKWRELLSGSSRKLLEVGAQRVRGEWVSNVPLGEMSIARTEAGRKLRNILGQLRRLNAPNSTLAMNMRPTHAPLVLVFVGRGSVFEEEMDSLLVDDPVGKDKSYVDFLVDVHKAVREKSREDF